MESKQLSKNEQLSWPIPLAGVGKHTAKQLARLNIFSIEDLLLHLPIRYLDQTKITAIRHLSLDQHALIEGKITALTQPKRGRTQLLCEIQDGTGRIYLRFFHLLSFQLKVLKLGAMIRCYGEVRLGAQGREMFHPEFKIIEEGQTLPTPTSLTPLYSKTEGISQYSLRKLMQHALNRMRELKLFNELLPSDLLSALSLPEFSTAVQMIHQPPQQMSVELFSQHQSIYHQRLIFEELLAHRLSLLQIKTLFQSEQSLPCDDRMNLSSQLIKHLPFDLTSAQKRVWQEVQADLKRASPMLRLVQGDVGSGKTVIAALAALQAIGSGFQVAMMAPTELLAAQHARNLSKWFSALSLQVIYLSGAVKGSERKKRLLAIAEGQAHIVIGTHAVFQEAVHFKQLALIIIDEQHRFGVEQRALLRDKACAAQVYPHQLVMTATPIPRTLAMSFYADLDCSIIDELPQGRSPIKTSVIANQRRDEIIARITEVCRQGNQVYWVCPLIDESELNSAQNATHTAALLQQALPELSIGLIHGRLSALEKTKVMEAFLQGDTQLLVATTVIEVGVDVPNANLMVIENAERLGLSQLHQLRGRVGRGGGTSYCVLLYQAPLSLLAQERLAVMRATTDGFKIAQRDLELRGPGEVLGTRQTGDLGFKLADLLRDSKLLPMVQQAADKLIHYYPERIASLIKRWLKDGEQYGKV